MAPACLAMEILFEFQKGSLRRRWPQERTEDKNKKNEKNVRFSRRNYTGSHRGLAPVECRWTAEPREGENVGIPRRSAVRW